MKLEEIQSWVRSAIIDDWKVAHTGNDGHLLTLERDGFVAIATLRIAYPQLKVYGSDRLHIKPPVPYSWRACVAAMKRCEECPDYVGVTTRAGFANRVCPSCAAKLETWTDEVTRD